MLDFMVERLISINYSCSLRVEHVTFAYFLDINDGVWLIANPKNNFPLYWNKQNLYSLN